MTERIRLAIVWRLPRWLVYWATIRVATTLPNGEFAPPGEQTINDVLKGWTR